MAVALPMHALTPAIDACEDAIVAALAADPSIVAYVPAASIAPFQGELAEAMQEVAVRPPAILVMWSGGDLEPTGSESFEMDAEWAILVFARNMRSKKASSNPDASGEIGAYDLVAHVLRVLTLQHLDIPGMGELVPSGVNLLRAGSTKSRTVTAYVVVFNTHLELQPVPPPDDLLEVATALEVARPSDGAWQDDGGDTIPLEGTS